MGASKEFGFPRKTIADYVSGWSSLDKPIGVHRIVGKQSNVHGRSIPIDVENKLVDKIRPAFKKGFGIKKHQHLMHILQLVKKLGIKTQFTNDMPEKSKNVNRKRY